MERQNSPKKVRRLNYQLLQEKKEQQLSSKVDSLTTSIKNNDAKIDELERSIVALKKEDENLVVVINQLLSAESKDVKERKEKLSLLAQQKNDAESNLAACESDLQKIIDKKLKDSQESPRLLDIKSRLAYLNTEINECKFKIEEYKKEAKKEQTLKADIEKLKKQEEKLQALINSGEKNPKRNYEEEIYVAKKDRENKEKQLQVFINAENNEIAELNALIAQFEKEAVGLNTEYDTLVKTQADAVSAMARIEEDSEVKSLRAKIATASKQIEEANTQSSKLTDEIAQIKAKELEAEKAKGKEQEYTAATAKLEASEKRRGEISTEIAKAEKEIVSLKDANEKLSEKKKEAVAGVTDCHNYNDWVRNNRKFSNQMYPRELEAAVRDYRADRHAATKKVMQKVEAEARKAIEPEIPALRQKAQDAVEESPILSRISKLKERAIENQFQRLLKFRIEKSINDSIEDGTNQTWNKAFKEIRDERKKKLDEAFASAEKRYFVDKNNNDAKEAYEAAKLALEMFQKSETDTTLLVVKNVRKYFPVERSFFGRPTRYLKAVEDVSFLVRKGKTLGIVGESGCGKTTMGRTVLRLHEITDGEIIFNGHHLESLTNKGMRPRRTELQIIFQDPYSSLSPRLPVGEIIGEAVKAHKIVPNSEYKDYIIGVMKSCGLQPHHYSRFPHEFSGGQRQRICIARALAVNPKVVICDEPVSALDVSIQAQIINLLKDLQKTRNLTYIFISHDLSVVEHISDDVGVMYLGSMVESGPKERIFENPMHPYTEALLSAVPVPDPNVKMNRITLQGDIPSPSRPPKGCKFHTRCPKCMDICKTMPPVYREYEEGHFVACHLYPQD